METILHYYKFDTSKPNHLAKYEALCQRLKTMGLKKFNAWSINESWDYYEKTFMPLNNTLILLETGFLFNNQWNTAPLLTSKNGLRIFDWQEKNIIHTQNIIKTGYYLEQTDEMIDIRNNTLVCCYCGKYEPAQKGYVFCPHCLGSQYLTEKDLYLTRMVPVSQKSNKALPKLTSAELDNLLPQFKEAQGLGKVSREKALQSKNRQKVANLIPETKQEAAKKIKEAEIETEAYTWLLDNELNILDNVIYYGHKKEFCFGWSKPIPKEDEADLDNRLAEFPFIYKIKTVA